MEELIWRPQIIDSEPTTAVDLAESYLFMNQFMKTVGRKASDEVKFIKAQQPDKELVAVTAERYGKRWTIGNIVGIFINPMDPSFIVCFETAPGQIEHAKFHDGRYRAYLTWIKNI